MKTITLPLDKLLDELLGDDHYRHVSPDIADILFAVCKNQNLIFIQREDRNGMKLQVPRLWRLWAWRQDTESWLAAKRRSDIERDARFVFEENVKRVAKAITRETFIEGDAARALAYRKMRKIETCRKFLTETWGVVLCNNVNEI